MRRRDFIAALGSASVAWPLVAHAQMTDHMRRVAVLLPAAANDVEFQARVRTFEQALQQSTWIIGQNLQIDTRWASNANDIRTQAVELVATMPDVILATGASTTGPLLQTTRSAPIVFVAVTDPVSAGFVDSLARPGGNATGFTSFEYGLSAKWVELLKEIAPAVTRIAVLRDPAIPSGVGQFTVIQTAATSIGVEAIPISMRDVAEIEHEVAAFARSANGGLILTVSGLAYLHRELIIALAAQYKLPAVYAERPFAAGGGLISYGPDLIDSYRRAAGYVDRILKGEKPADLPVQAPNKFELVINLKTARALGLTIPQSLRASADEVIE
jgi:putative ABC transport system substrate-binding protein